MIFKKATVSDYMYVYVKHIQTRRHSENINRNLVV